MTPSPQQSAEMREAEARKQWECEFSLLHGELPTTSEIEAFNAGMLAARRSPAGEGAEPFGYFVVDGEDMAYPGAGFVRTPVKGRQYKSVTPLFSAPPSPPVAEPNWDAVVESMCLTMRHDYGLEKVERAPGEWPFGLCAGMNERERQALRINMRQLIDNCIRPALTKAGNEKKEDA